MKSKLAQALAHSFKTGERVSFLATALLPFNMARALNEKMIHAGWTSAEFEGEEKPAFAVFIGADPVAFIVDPANNTDTDEVLFTKFVDPFVVLNDAERHMRNVVTALIVMEAHRILGNEETFEVIFRPELHEDIVGASRLIWRPAYATEHGTWLVETEVYQNAAGDVVQIDDVLEAIAQAFAK